SWSHRHQRARFAQAPLRRNLAVGQRNPQRHRKTALGRTQEALQEKVGDSRGRPYPLTVKLEVMAFPSEQKLEEFLTPMLAEHQLDVEQIKTTKAGKKSQVVRSEERRVGK